MANKLIPKQMSPLTVPGQRFIHPSSIMPTPMEVGRWRLVAQEPINRLARKMIQREVASLNWQVTPLDPQNEEHQVAALYYTQIFKNLRSLITRTLKSVCEIPQGGAWEIGWTTPALFDEGIRGTLSFVKFIDAGTLWPTPNKAFPVVQIDPVNSTRKVSFRPDEIHRVLAYPRDEFDRIWWQESPTESAYLAIEALSRIYVYYLKQLGDTPVAGILDLMDFEQESATAWAKDFREMLTGIDPIKIPILYEHEVPAKWLPMGRNPSELDIPAQFQRFAEMVLSNYGLSLSDLRMFDVGSTKAAAAVSRKISTQSGIGFFAELIKDVVQELLPHYLIFGYSDVDIEQERTKAQIRAANARTIMSIEGLPLYLKLEQLKKWEVLDIDFDPKQIEKEAEDKVGVGVGLASGGTKQPGQLETGEGKRRDVLEDDAKENAAGGTRIFAKSITEEIDGAVARFKQNFSTSKLGRKKAKAAKSLEQLLGEEFRRIGREVTPSRVKDLQDRLLTQVPEVLLGVIQEPMEAKAAIWDDMLDQFSRGNYNQVEKIDTVRLRIEALLDTLLDDADFFEMDEDAILDETIRIYRLAYEDGLLGAAETVQTGLFRRLLRDKPIITRSFSLTNPATLDFLENKALETISNIDSGTKFFFKRMMVEGVMQGMSVDVLTDQIQSQLFGLPEEDAGRLNRNRIRSIVTTEINRAESLGRLGQMEAIGLTLKIWITRKIDVCPVCIANEALGSVPLDFLFTDVFGDTLTPPGHPVTCHCSIGADAKELEDLGNVEFWFGGEKPRQKADVIKGEFIDFGDINGTVRREIVYSDLEDKAYSSNGKKKKKKAKRKKEEPEREKFNPHHVPAGVPEGGQFTTAEGVGGSALPRNEKLAEALTSGKGVREDMVEGVNENYKFTTEDGEEFFIKEVIDEFKYGGHTDSAKLESRKEILARQVAEAAGVKSVILNVEDVSYREESFATATEWADGNSWADSRGIDLADNFDGLSDEEFTKAIVAEFLIDNIDRHDGNVMITEDGRLLLIDNGRSFGTGEPSTIVEFGVFTNMAFSENLPERQLNVGILTRATTQTVRNKVENIVRDSGFLESNEIDSLIQRHDFLVEAASIAEERGSITNLELMILAEGGSLPVEKFNPHHVPAGVPEGGQFTSADGDGGTSSVPPSIHRFDEPITRKIKVGGEDIQVVEVGKIKHKAGEVSVFATMGVPVDELEDYTNNLDVALSEIDSDHLENLDSVVLDTGLAVSGGYSGTYSPEDGQIRININEVGTLSSGSIEFESSDGRASSERKRHPRSPIDNVFKHEVGHHVWWNVLNESQRVRFAELANSSNPEAAANLSLKALKDTGVLEEKVSDISTYGSSNILEAWSESYTTIDWNNRINMNSNMGPIVNGAEHSTRQFQSTTEVLREISGW